MTRRAIYWLIYGARRRPLYEMYQLLLLLLLLPQRVTIDDVNDDVDY